MKFFIKKDRALVTLSLVFLLGLIVFFFFDSKKIDFFAKQELLKSITSVTSTQPQNPNIASEVHPKISLKPINDKVETFPFQDLENCLKQKMEFPLSSESLQTKIVTHGEIDLLNFHFVDNKGQVRRIQILPSEGETQIGTFEIREFTEDSEGLPVPVRGKKQYLSSQSLSAKVAELKAQLNPNYTEERAHFNEQGLSVKYFLINNQFQELEFRNSNGSFLCEKNNCHCISR